MWNVPVFAFAAVVLAVAVLAARSGLSVADTAGLLFAASAVWFVWALLYVLPHLRGKDGF